MASIKVLKKLHQQNDRKSLVKDLISLRPISPVDTTDSHPLEVLYNDSNPHPHPVDQFAPYLSRKLSIRRSERIEKLKKRKKPDSPTFELTNCSQAKSPDPVSLPNLDEDSINIPPRRCNTAMNPRKCTSNSQNGLTLTQYIKMEQVFDKIASGSASMAMHRLVESNLQIYFVAEKVLFYHDISAVKVLYCPTTTGYCPHGSGLVGYAQFSRQTIRATEARLHISYSPKLEGNQISPDSQVLVFPVFDGLSNVKGVIEVIRNKDAPPFTDEDEKFAEYFQLKCKMYSSWLFQPSIDESFESSLMKTCRVKPFVDMTQEKLTQLFSCRTAEIWSFNKQTEKIYKYTNKSDVAVEIPIPDAGIAGFALRQGVPISCITSRVHSAYNEKIDGNGSFSALVIPVRDPDNPVMYAVILRGKRIPQFFTDYDEKILARIIPYVISSLNSAELIEKNHKALKDSMHQQKRLRSLLEVAETLSGQLRMDVLIPNIMQRACELVRADRCSLFMVNETHDKLVTSFQGGLKNSIEIPLNAGIVGFTATTGEILNIKDAYEDPRFNRATDLATGYRTLTILSVPIFDDQGQIRGVTEMINKLDGVFTDEDEKMIKIFNVFCGISLENARLYRASIDLSLQLRSFLDISYSLSQPQTFKKLMEEILRNSRKVLGAVRAALFMIENNGISFNPFVLDEDIEAKVKKVQQKKQEEAEDSLGVKRAIIAKLLQGKSSTYDAEEAKEEERRNKFIEQVISTKESIVENDDEKTELSMMLVPIMSSDRAIMGAVMMQWKKNNSKFTYDDLKLLESYSVFLSISIERSRLKTIAQLGSIEVEMQTWVTFEERELCEIPKRLELSESESLIAISKDFETNAFKGIGLFKVLFYIFDLFGLLKTYKINAEMLYHFLYDMKSTYNQVPYHNWNHACDVTQFLAYTIHYTGLSKVFTQFEILGMLVAAICHDANHDGFSNQYNVKAQTPLGILFRNQSVMETHHCSVSIGVLTKDQSNLFHTLSECQVAKMWSLFINLILATDMAKHFQFIEQGEAMLKRGEDWHSSESGRLLIMQLLLKSADVSNVSRKFTIANKWCDVLCEEFFRQGDLEKATGMECTSPMNDREHLDKPRSQIGFYKSVCLPLFEECAKHIPEINVQVEQVKENMIIWEEQAVQREIEEKKKAEAEAQALESRDAEVLREQQEAAESERREGKEK